MIGMIPRTKVNYRLGHLLKALFITDSGPDYRQLLVDRLRNYLAQDHILLTPSGRGGLYYLLQASPISRVLIPAYTCKVVAEAALLAGKQVIGVDVEEDGFNMSITALESVLDGPAVVIATHQFGIPCQIEETVELCRQRGAVVIEDAAASLGSRVNGRLTGTFGDAAFFSFDSTKLVNVPMKGGFVVVQDPAWFARLQHIYQAQTSPMPLHHKLKLLIQAAALVALENHLLYRVFHTLYFERRGQFTDDTPVLNPCRGEFYDYDLANWQAYLAAEQMARIETIIQARQDSYAAYQSSLRDCRAFVLPPRDEHKEWACIRFPIRVRGDKLAYYKKAVKRGLDFAFSFTFIPYPEGFPNARRLANAVLDLPFYLKLSSDERRRVIAILKDLEAEVHPED